MMLLRGNGMRFGSCPSTTSAGGLHVSPLSSEKTQVVYASGESPPPTQLAQRRPFGVRAAPLFIAHTSFAARYFAGTGAVMSCGGTSARSATASIARRSSARTLSSGHSSAQANAAANRQTTGNNFFIVCSS